MRRLTLKEASALADRFDKLGYTEEANMLDEYISASDDIVKQAGIWDRVKGRIKKIFSKEWRELHDKALKAQSNIEDAIKKIEDLAKELRKDVKNYRINDWGYKIRYVAPKLGLNTSEFAYEFNTAYARYLGHWLKFNDMKNRGIGTEGMDPSEMLVGIPTPVGFGIKRLEQIHDEENKGLWQVVGKEGENPIEKKSSVPTDIRIPKTRFNDIMLKQYISIGKFPETNQEGFVIFKPKGKSLPKTVEEHMGGAGAFYVELQSEDVNYIYLRKIGDVTLEPGTAKITGVKSHKEPDPVLEKALETEKELSKKQKPEKAETSVESEKLPSYPNIPDVEKQDKQDITKEKAVSEAPIVPSEEVVLPSEEVVLPKEQLQQAGKPKRRRSLKERKEKIEELVSQPSTIPLAKEHAKQLQKAKSKKQKASQDPNPEPQSVQEEQEEELGMRPPTGEFSVFKAPVDADDSFLTRRARVNIIIKLVKG